MQILEIRAPGVYPNLNLIEMTFAKLKMPILGFICHSAAVLYTAAILNDLSEWHLITLRVNL